MNLLRVVFRRFAVVEEELKHRVKPKTYFELLAQTQKMTKAQTVWNRFLAKAEKPAVSEPKIDIQENFLYGFKKEDFEGRSPLIKQALSLSNATDKQLLGFKKAGAIRKFQNDLLDTGSPQVQVACLTEKINHMVGHCVSNNKDHKSKRKLKELFSRRVRLLNVLRRKNPNYYIWVVRDFNIQQSQKKLDTYKLLNKEHKKGVKARKRFMYKSYNTTGFRVKDIQKMWHLKRIEELKHK